MKKIDSGEINLSGNATFSLAENTTSNIFSFIEAITQHPPILLDNFHDIIEHILPVLASFSKSDDGNLRILSMKLFSDIATFFMDYEPGDVVSPNQESDSNSLFLVCFLFFTDQDF